jgi:hypothetical protein
MDKTGHWVFEIDGIAVGPLAYGNMLALSKRDAQRILIAKLGITDRRARATVSSYTSEGWALPFTRLNEPRFAVNSFEARVLEHADRRYDSCVENGRKGGRPPKCPVSGGSNW